MTNDSKLNSSSSALWRVHGLMIFAFMLIATSFLVMDKIAGEMDSSVLTLLRFGLAAILLLPIVLYRGLKTPNVKALLNYTLLGLLQAVYFNSMFEALRYTSSVNASTLFTAAPFVSAVLAFCVLRERLNTRMIIALFFSFGGALWVIMQGSIDNLLNMSLNKGDAIFLISVLSFGIYTPLINYFYRGEPMLLMTFWTIVTGTFWLLLFANFRVIDVAWDRTPSYVYWGISYLAVFTTIVTFFITQFCSVIIGPTKMTAYTYLTPSLVLLMNWLIGAGGANDHVVVGVALTLVASLVLQWDGSRIPFANETETNLK